MADIQPGATSPSDCRPFRLGATLIDPNRNILARGPVEHAVEPRIMDVLRRLAEQPGDVVSRNDLIRSIWQVDFGGDDSLTRAVSILRKTFKELGHDGAVIETIPRRGYRLVARPDYDSAAPATGASATDNGASDLTRNNSERVERPQRRHVATLFGALAACVLAGAALWLGRSADSAAPTPARSVAVLPFVTLSDARNDTIFAEGLSEELFAKIAGIEGLNVPGRTASAAYRDTQKDFQTIGEELGVAYVLEGSVRRDGDRVRIMTQLVSTDNGYRLWSETYDRTGDDIFIIQDDIARRVASVLNARILGDGETLQSSAGTRSARAYEAYLQGRYFAERGGPSLSRAIDQFETAIAADPQFAKAHAALASAHAVSNLHLNVPKAIARSRTVEHARNAIALDPSIAEPYAALSALEGADYKWDAADRYLDDAETRDPNDPATLYWRARTLLNLGYLDAAKKTIDRAVGIDAGSPALQLIAGHIAFSRGDLDTADDHYRRAQALGMDAAVFDRSHILFQRGEYEKSADLIATASVHYQLIARDDVGALSTAMQRLMKRESTVDAALATFPTLVNDDDMRAVGHLYSRQRQRALQTIQSDGDGDSDAFFKIWTDIDPDLRTDPYFRIFAANTGLLAYWRENGWPDRCSTAADAEFSCR